MLELMPEKYAIQLLFFSGALAILWSCFLGLFMMIPHLRNDMLTKATRGVNFRQLLAAHLDWLMLAFMQGIAAGLILAFDLSVPLWVIIALIFSGWMNAVPYFLRAFGINAFVYGGNAIQKIANILGGVSVFVMIAAWIALIFPTAKIILA